MADQKVEKNKSAQHAAKEESEQSHGEYRWGSISETGDRLSLKSFWRYIPQHRQAHLLA